MLLGVSVPHRSTKSPMAQTQPLHGFSAGTFLLQYVSKPRSHVADCMTRCFARRSRPHRVPACDTMEVLGRMHSFVPLGSYSWDDVRFCEVLAWAQGAYEGRLNTWESQAIGSSLRQQASLAWVTA